MSLCRVIIRLEIANTAESFISLDFVADLTQPLVAQSKDGGTVADDNSLCLLKPPSVVQLDSTRESLYLGSRHYQTITVELYSSQLKCEDSAVMASGIASSTDSSHSRWASWSDADKHAATAAGESGSDMLVDHHDVKRPSSGKMWSSSHMTPHSVKFVSGNPSVEKTEGIIHLFREDQVTNTRGESPRSCMICMLKVPATFSSQDLLQFIAPVEPDLEHIRSIRDGTPNQYMVLLKFRDESSADEFYKMYNDQPFNSIEPEICHLVYVARVESMLSSQGAGLTPAGSTELPNCTVCLERMDESVKGILTILCNHSFHVACLAEWKDTSCPVCRYVQTPAPTGDNKCFECSSQLNLWICLICGFVGCGRYDEGHAYGHFKETSHTYSMELGSSRVWDYAGDNYVHRLVQNKADGKLVEVDEQNTSVHEEKIDSLNLEYTYLLTSQLESQRLYFEDKMTNVERQSQRQVEELEAKVRKAIDEMTRLEQQLSVVDRDKKHYVDEMAKTEQQLSLAAKEKAKLAVRLGKLTSELDEERQLNRCLRDNQLTWQSRVTELENSLAKKDVELAELRDELRDVMFYLEAKDTLAKTTDATQQEIEQGQIVVHSSSATASQSSVVSPASATGSSSKKTSRSKKR